MKLRYAILFLFAAVLLSACTLASDITPPPDYVPPAPQPTLGPLFPPSAPEVQSGAAIFASKCAPCHGDKGLGDGPQGQQLPVPVPAIGLPDKGENASPVQWYQIVTQGNMDRYMPPFASLSDQERWNVVSFVLTLHTTPDQIAKGKSLFEANCPNCADKFTDQKKMAALSEADLVGIIKKGNADVSAFGANFSDDDAFAVAAYLRTLTFALPAPPTAAPTTAPTSTIAPTSVGATPATPGTPATSATVQTSGTSAASGTAAATTSATEAGTPATPAAATGTVSGVIQMGNGSALPSNLAVTLRGYDHSQDSNGNTTPTEVVTKTGAVAADGTYTFDNVELVANRIYLAEVAYSGVQFQSDFKSVTAGDPKLELSPLKLYDSSTDTSLLTVDQVHLYSDFATQGSAQFIEIYSFSNKSDKAVIISPDGSTIPFIKLPEGAQGAGYQAGQNSAPFVAADKGVAVVPSNTAYAIIGFFTLPYDKQLTIKQPFAIDVPSVLVLIPDGMKADGSQLVSKGVQTIQNNTYQEYSGKDFKVGDTLTFTVSGSPKTASTPLTTANTQQGLLIGAGALGLALIVAGVWLYLRDRRRSSDDDDDEEFESSEDVMDAILALDDLHRTGKISDEAYQTRRAELKEILKELM